jgi:sporulation protein YlmC with PRC-barrel domain
MRKSAKGLIVAGVVPLLLAPALGLAERDTDAMHHERGQAQHEQARGEAYEHRAETARAGHEGKAQFLSEQKQDQFSAESLIGKPLKAQDDEDIGEIADLLLDRQGNVAGVIVSVSGELGTTPGEFDREGEPADTTGELDRERGPEGREIALSWDAIDLDMEDGEPVARANIDREQLEQASEFETRDEQGLGAPRTGYEREHEREHEGVATREYERDQEGVAARDYEGDQEGVAARDYEGERDPMAERGMERDRFITRQEMDHFTADNLIGSSVQGVDGEEIGQIADLLIDRDGSVAGVVVGVGGFLGMGERNVALSWDAIQLATDEDGQPVAHVDVDEGTLENAPEFEERDDGGVW